MWKRDQQILDVYGINSLPGLQAKDDSLIVTTATKSLYKLPLLSYSQPSLYTRNISSTRVYEGDEFDVFKKQVTEEAPVIEQPTTKQKRTSISYLIDKEDVVTKKKRRTESAVMTKGVFIKSTAPVNTPANIFMTHPEAEQNALDLEYN